MEGVMLGPVREDHVRVEGHTLTSYFLQLPPVATTRN